jgi:uncharacterized protein (DUF433 family)
MKHERITVNPAVMVGKPCIRGTRIPVEQLLRELSGGMSFEEVLDAHPRLTVEDIYAAIDYAADVVRQIWLTTQPALLGEHSDAISS